MKEMRWWDTSIGDNQQGGQTTPDGLFSLMPEMPRERAYAKAVILPNGFAPAVALVGGIDKTGAPIKEIDIFQFNDPLAPNSGSWSTFSGTLPEALVGCGGGYNDGGAGQGEAWVLAFGGWTGSKFSTTTFNARVGSGGGLVIREPLQVVPRRGTNSAQSGCKEINTLIFNRSYLMGGADENGSDPIVEAFGLP
jgi:hypothetical protein